MKLNQLWIQRYGPLNRELRFNDDLTVVHGPNESGKSLLVEAISKYFMDVSIPESQIEEYPAGYIEVIDEGNRSHKLDGETTLTDFYREYYNRELRPEELLNIFIIRNGDLSFQDDDRFYSHITDKLTGRRVEDIKVIRGALLDAGRITRSRMNVSSADRYDSAGTHVDNAGKLLEEIDEYLEMANEKGLVENEAQYLAAKTEEQRLSTRLEELEVAKANESRRRQIHDLTGYTETIEGNREELDALPDPDALSDIEDRLESLIEREGELPSLRDHRDQTHRLARLAIIAGLIAFGVLLPFGLPLIGGMAVFLFVGIGVYFWHKGKQIGTRISDLQTGKNRIVSDARAAGLTFDSREEIRGKIASIDKRRRQLYDETQRKIGVLRRELDLSDESIETTLDDATDALAKLRDSLDDESAMNYDERVERRTNAAHERVKHDRERLESEMHEHENRLQEFNNRAYQIEFNAFVGKPLQLEIVNIDALARLRDQLDELIAAIEKDADAARTSIDIIDEILDEERSETAELFEDGSRASELFREITDDRYRTVTYETDSNQLVVEKSTGEIFSPEQLSEGTRDQLYLSIRVALGENILEGRPGFFIMDDAFLTSDPVRLATQADVMMKLIEAGWQIIYLTSKSDAVDELTERSSAVLVDLPPLE